MGGGLATCSRFIFNGPRAFIGAGLPAPPIDFPIPLTPDLAAEIPMADFPPAVDADFKAILVGAKAEVDDGATGRDDDDDADEPGIFDPAGEGSLRAREEMEGDGLRLEAGEGSRRALAEEAVVVEGLAMPPVEARPDLGGGRRLLPASGGLVAGLEDVAVVVAVVDVTFDVVALGSRGPSAVFFLARGACKERR